MTLVPSILASWFVSPSPCGAGTDVLGMSTKAERSPDGASFKIDGAKMWITNGTTDGRNTGDVFLVYARTGPGRQDISMFIVEKARPGVSSAGPRSTWAGGVHRRPCEAGQIRLHVSRPAILETDAHRPLPMIGPVVVAGVAPSNGGTAPDSLRSS